MLGLYRFLQHGISLSEKVGSSEVRVTELIRSKIRLARQI
jgi:hypothetical protein